MNFDMRVRDNYATDSRLAVFVNAFQENHYGAHPMGILQSLIACHSSFYPEANPAFFGGQFGYKTQEERDVHIHRVLGMAPIVTAKVLRVFT